LLNLPELGAVPCEPCGACERRLRLRARGARA